MQFRKSKTFGGLRFSLSKKGLGVSVGAGPLRVGVGADGKVRRTVRVPGIGAYDTKVIGSTRRPKARGAVIDGVGNEAPRCTAAQKNFLAGVIQGRTGESADCKGVTLLEAEQILYKTGVAPGELYRSGRMPAKSEQQAPWAAGFGCA